MKWQDITFYFFIFWYICGVVLLSFDLIPSWLEWANAVFLILAGLLAVFYFIHTFRLKVGLILTIIIFISTFIVEYFGASVSFLFGDYYYTDRFAPNVFGVPLAIGFAWLMVMGTSHALTKQLHKWLRPFAGGFVALTIDLIIDPVAYQVKQYWIWEEPGAYYHIPWTNFFGWFVVAFVLHAVILLFEKMGAVSINVLWTKRMAVVFILMILMFVIIGVIHGLWLAVSVTIGFSTIILLIYSRKRAVV